MFSHIRRALAGTTIPQAPVDETIPAQEKMVYNLFQRNFESYRAALVPGRMIDLATMQLPNSSTLHTINHFLSPQPTDDINPDLTNPLLTNEQWVIYLQHYLPMATKTTTPFPVADRVTYVANRYKAQILAFFHQHHHFRRLLSESAVARLSNALVVNEYAALNHVRVTGLLNTYRHFDIILRTMLDHICNSNDKRYHFLQFPLSARPYTRAQFVKCFEKISTSTLRVTNDPSYFLLIHLLGLLYGEHAEPRTPLPVADRALLPEGAEPPVLTSTSLFARLPDDVLERLHVVLTHNGKAIIYNLADLKKMAISPAMFLRVLRHVNLLKLHESAIELPDEMTEDEAFDDAIAAHHAEAVAPPEEAEPAPNPLEAPVSDQAPVVTVPAPTPEAAPSPATDHPTPIVAVAPPIAPPISHLAPVQSLHTQAPKVDYHQHVLQHLHERMEAAPETSEIPHTRVQDLYSRHLSVALGGRSIAQHLASSLPDVHTNTLDFLQDKLPDPTMAHSSIANLDTLYIQHGMHHDLASTLTSLVQHGLFVTHIDESEDFTEFTRRTVYKAALVDVHGKRHSLVFSLPHVSPTGQMMINGVATRMTKQQVNLPICKVSDDRVNLITNFNKTIVERTATRRHSFVSYFTTYLSALRREGLVNVSYGKLPDSPIRLPYDYSAVGQTYTRIEGESGTLIFDYEKRFVGIPKILGGTEAYSEANSRFTHEDRQYSLTRLLKHTESLPIQAFSVDDLKWILDHDTPDPKRVADADLAKPILVAKTKDGLVTIDGLHRLAKAVQEGVTSLPGRLVGADRHTSKAVLDQFLIRKPTTSVDILRDHEHRYGVFCGTTNIGGLLFMGMDNHIREIIHGADGPIDHVGRPIVDLLHAWYPQITPNPMISEWTELKILDDNFPVIFVLGFRFGLSKILAEHHISYRWRPTGEKSLGAGRTELRIPFADGDLIIPRYPLQNSLLVAGLLKYPTEKLYRAEFDTPDVYYRLLMQANVSINYLRGITNFFDFFIDPITLDVLQHMGEPTTVRGLLLRANEMLSTYEHHEAASMVHHRLRGYERFSGVLYNEMARQLSAFQNKRSPKKSFSINPEAVFQKIMLDSTVSSVETINPMHEIKGNTGITYAGSGGRTSKSFVVEDRRYPEDALGVLSEATPDSGKVAMNAYTTADPKLANLRGMFTADRSDLTPANVLSSTAMLMPCSVQDD